ncbi:MAG: MarR family winged helix-turn-helix transcriptional regulator, partial [Plesiomonas sp.]
MEKHDEVMVSIRQIIRAIDLKSKQLNKAVGLTTPQLMLMQAIDRHGDVSLKVLAEQTNISQATASTILDRLESRQLV